MQAQQCCSPPIENKGEHDSGDLIQDVDPANGAGIEYDLLNEQA